MGLLEAGAAIGSFLLEHMDVVEDVVDALAGGSPKDAIKAAIRSVKVQVARDALEGELDAATKRRAENHGQRAYEAFWVGPVDVVPWDTLPTQVQACWERAADAARGA